MGHIFISYSRRDKEFVERFVGVMESAGLSVWIDRQKIKAGKLWRTQIVQAVDTCDGFILMLSTNSATSDNVRREIDLAHDSGRSIFVMTLEQVKLPAEIRYQLIGLQQTNLQTLGLHKGANQLIETLNEQSTVTDQQPIRQVELVFQGIHLGAFNHKKQEQLLGFLSQLTNTSQSQFKIANLTAGSVHVFVDMPAMAAFGLKALALSRDSHLKKFGIKSLRLVSDKKYVNSFLGSLTTTPTIGFLNLLWMSIPALFPSLFGVVVGKVFVIISALAATTAVGYTAAKILPPIISPTQTSIVTPTNMATFMPTNIPTLSPTDTPALTPMAADTLTPTPTNTPTLTPTDSPTLTATDTLTPTPTNTPTSTPTDTPTPTPVGAGGQKIAFVENNQIWTINLDGTEKTQLTSSAGYNHSPDWSPDGKKIVFVSNRDGSSPQIYVMNADGNSQTRLTFDNIWCLTPAWSPDGQYIAFAHGLAAEAEIYIMAANGSGPTPITANKETDVSPDWSPDGSRIVFASGRDGEPGGLGLKTQGTYVMSANGTEQTRLTFSSKVNENEPSWSPDGTHIAFVSARDGNREIYIMNPNGSGGFNLTHDPTDDSDPDWSPDSTMIVYSSDGMIYIIGIDGTIVRRLTNGSGPSWQP